ncbi:hypothetical protein ACFLRI_02425 [Bacteroidota bacterium]
MTHLRRFFLIFLPLLLFFSCNSLDKKKIKEENKQKFESLDQTTKELLEIISGNAGENRDWERFRELFLPNAVLTAVIYSNDSVTKRSFTVDQYIQFFQTTFQEEDFVKIELHKQFDIFGNIAQVFQTYGTSTSHKANKSQRGINSIQLIYLDKKWRIVSVLWDVETSKSRIPSIYLGTDKREILPS